jgi:hypothetical protein
MHTCRMNIVFKSNVYLPFISASDVLGAQSNLAMQLANFHSEAIDIVKNGSTVEIPQAILDGSFKYPHCI